MFRQLRGVGDSESGVVRRRSGSLTGPVVLSRYDSYDDDCGFGDGA
jgi:hypothetical protein